MTGSLQSLLCTTDYPGFVNLRYLQLENAGLNQDDLVSIGEAVNENLIPRLRCLYTGKNDFPAVETKVNNLVNRCTMKYKKLNLMLQFYEHNLPETFVNKMKAICEGTGYVDSV